MKVDSKAVQKALKQIPKTQRSYLFKAVRKSQQEAERLMKTQMGVLYRPRQVVLFSMHGRLGTQLRLACIQLNLRLPMAMAQLRHFQTMITSALKLLTT